MHLGVAMKIKEISASSSTNNTEADAIKRQQKQLADRKAQLDVQKTEKRLVQQRKKLSTPSKTGTASPKPTKL